jgi:hypothetical protein
MSSRLVDEIKAAPGSRSRAAPPVAAVSGGWIHIGVTAFDRSRWEARLRAWSHRHGGERLRRSSSHQANAEGLAGSYRTMVAPAQCSPVPHWLQPV